jgi:hypothetical protein
MSVHDFLHVRAKMDLCEHYAVADSVLCLTTNHASLLESARGTFPVIDSPAVRADFSLGVWVDNTDASKPPWPQPYVRGLHHRVFAGFDTKSSMLADLTTGRVFGRFSPAMAGDVVHFRTVVFPVLMSIVAGSAGFIELHASCIAKKGRALVLLGPSQSGKSTLALAMVRSGFQLLSDDRIFCFLRGGKVFTYGLPRPLKLRREASTWFEEFRDRVPTLAQNGESVFYCDAKSAGNFPYVPACELHASIFLEQQRERMFRMTRIQASESRKFIESDLLAESPQAMEAQDRLLDRIVSMPCWRLQYNESPQSVSQKIAAVAFESSGVNESSTSLSGEDQ